MTAPNLRPGTPACAERSVFCLPLIILYENLTVAENLRFFASLVSAARTTPPLRKMLAAVQLAARQSEYVANLSSGLKCRLSIAKWRLLQPELLLLDEPYGVLDGSGVDLLEDFLQGAMCPGRHRRHRPRIMSRACCRLCNRAVILHQGRVTFDETKRQPWPSFDQAFGEFLPHGDS